MAQWYAQLVFKGDTFLGDGLADWEEVNGVVPSSAGVSGAGGADVDASTGFSPSDGVHYTTVIVSGYALYGQLQGYYALGVAHIMVDLTSGRARYLSEQSALHYEPLDSLSPAQRAAIREWLIGLNRMAWDNSTEPFRRSLS